MIFPPVARAACGLRRVYLWCSTIRAKDYASVLLCDHPIWRGSRLGIQSLSVCLLFDTRMCFQESSFGWMLSVLQN